MSTRTARMMRAAMAPASGRIFNRAAVANPAARSWFSIVNKGDGTAEIYLYDEIGAWGTSAGDFAKELAGVKASRIDLRLNTPGGEVFDGLAIYAALKRHPATVTVHVDGLAASIASAIAMAGEKIFVDRRAQMMIHEAHAIACGSTKDMTAMAKLLDQYSDNIAAIYAERAGGTQASWRARMKDETWLNATEAVAAGLADEITSAGNGGKPTAVWDLSIFNFAGRDAAPAPLLDAADPPPDAPAEPVAAEPTEQPASLAEVVLDVLAVEPADPVPLPFDPDGFRAAMVRAKQVDYDPQVFRELMASVAADAPALPAPPQRPVELGPVSAPASSAQPPADLGPWDVFRSAMRLVANDAPAPPPPTKPESPADEPGFLMDADAFRTALRRATL